MSTSYYKPEAHVLVDAELAELEQFVIGAATTFLEKTLRLPPRRLEIERSWINVFKPGAQEAQHSHDGSLLSCSYYVEAPKDCGCIVMPDPIGARRSYREFTKTAGTDVLTRRDIAVEPQPGRLVMFESWLPHYVQCNKSDQVRISIAMNLREARPQVAVTRAGGAEASAPASEPQRATAAASAAAPPTESADAKPFLFEQVFEVRTDLKLKLEPIREHDPDDRDRRLPEASRGGEGYRRSSACSELEAREGWQEFRRLLRLPAAFSDPLPEQHDCRRAAGHSPGL